MLNVPKKMVMNILQYLILNTLLNINLILGAYFIFGKVFTKAALKHITGIFYLDLNYTFVA
jgi:hypothetical protein